MEDGLKRLPIAFYRSANGTEPVRGWLKALCDADRQILGYDIGLVEFGWPVGMPLCRALGGGLWEVRSSLTGNRIARVIFCVAHDRMVLLNGFVKKTQKAPKSELELARKRQKEVEQ
jgi:phage-related protein